jgi:TolB protein
MRTPKAAVLVTALALGGLAAPASAPPLRLALAGKSAAGHLDLFTVTPAGDGRQKITTGPANDTFPAFAPARDQIVFTRIATNGKRHLFTVRPSGGAVHVIPNTLGAEAPSWSPDAAHIAFDAVGGGIYAIEPDGGGRTQLSDGATDRTPDWSPDSARIVFSRGGQIWRMDADGTHLKKLANKGVEPAWAPNGEHIAFARTAKAGGPGVFAMDPDGSHVKKLTTKGRRPAWEPNSRHLAFATAAGGNSKIRTVLFGGTKGITTLVTAGQTPAW